MRILTVMSGVVLSATGAGCLAYYSNTFSSIAFVLGVVMIISAIFLLGAFLLSSKNRLPDTVLVEGMMTLIFGFVILNNEVTDTVISMFFGAWLTVSGIVRFSQSLSVSRFDTKNWHKIMPLGIVSAIFGFIMLMHSLISTWNQLTLVGITLMLNGFSQLIYAMYMVKPETLPQAEQARQRVETKQRIAEEKRKERDSLRKLDKKEREKRQEELREAKRIEALEKKRALKAQKEKEKSEREALLEPTVHLAGEEDSLALAEEAPGKADPQLNSDIAGSEVQDSWDLISKEASWESALKAERVEEQVVKRTTIMSFPEDEISFIPPGKQDVTEILETEVTAPEPGSFKPLVLEDLIEEEKQNDPEEEKRKSEEDKKRFTEEFFWDWPIKN